MGIESTRQQPNGDPALLYSPSGGLAHTRSEKPQPYPTLESPTHPKTLCPDYRRRRHSIDEEDEEENATADEYAEELEEDKSPDYQRWHHWTDDEEEEEEVEDDDEFEEGVLEEVEEEMDDAKREEIQAAVKAHVLTLRSTARERMTMWADRYARKHSAPLPPPIEMLNFPDLFERAWGWDMILPRDISNPWSRYKEYLSAYYYHNLKEANAAGDADDNGDDLASLAHSCIEMEKHLLFLWKKFAMVFPTDDRKVRRVSNKVTKCAQEIVNALKVELPAASVALKCITKEAELMCGWLISKAISPISHVRTSNEIRKCALSLMVCKGPEYRIAMATMMGVMKEAKVVQRFLWNLEKENGHLQMSLYIRDCTSGAMFRICDEYFTTKDSPRGSTARACVSKESDGKNFSEKKLVKKDKLVLRNGISQNANVETKQSTKVGSVTGRVKRGNAMEGNEKQKLRLLLGPGSDEEFARGNNYSVEKEDDKKSSFAKNDDERKNTSEENERRTKELIILELKHEKVS